MPFVDRLIAMRSLPIVLLLAGCRQILGIDDPVVRADAALEDAAIDAPPLVTEDGWASGSRLKLAWNDYRGVRADLSMFDPQLGVQCIAYAWADGRRYCAPRNFTPPFEGIGYLDEACTQPVGYRLGNSACSQQNAPVFLTQAEQRECVGYVRSKVFRRGALRATPANLYVNHSGTCEPTDFPASSYDVYDLGAEVPTSDLVEMTEVRIPLDDRVSRIDYRGSDGSSFASTAYDTMLDVGCSLSEGGTCAPVGGGSSGVFADSACSMVLSSVQAGCPAPRFGSRQAQPGCPTSTTRYFEVGAKRQVAPLYQLSGMACTTALPNVNLDYYDAPTEVTAAMLPRSVDAPPQGSAIALVHFGTGTERTRANGAYDYTHNTPCSTQGGRCLPANGGGTSTYFTDAGCLTQRTFAITTGTVVGCAAPPVPEYVVAQSTGPGLCSTTYTVYRLGARYMGPLYSGSPGSCNATSSSFDLYELGDVVPQVEFAVATPKTDP